MHEGVGGVDGVKVKKFILGPGQLASFLIIILVILFAGGSFGLNWYERWSLGAILGLVVSCFIYYIAIEQKTYAFLFGGIIVAIAFTIPQTIHNPLIHLLEGIAIAFLLVRADLGRVPSSMHKRGFDRFFVKAMVISPPSPVEQSADPDADKALRILHYVDYPQLVGLVAIAIFYIVALKWFSSIAAHNFVAGAYAFQLVSASITLTFIDLDSKSEV